MPRVQRPSVAVASNGSQVATQINRMRCEGLVMDMSLLNEDPINARLHPEKNMEAIKASLTEFGQMSPITVREQNMTVMKGNGTFRAAKLLGWTKIKCSIIPMTDLEAIGYGIADNRAGELAEWDEVTRQSLVKMLEEAGLGIPGYTSGELDAILMEDLRTKEEKKKEKDDIPVAPKIPITQMGDLWMLGGIKGHRLLCGDSMSNADVLRLMNGRLASLCATDPPYLVDYTGDRPNDSGKDWTASYKEIEIKDAIGFFTAVFTNVLEVIRPRAAIYCWYAHKRSGEIQQVWRDVGILDHQQIVWVKPTPVFGRVFWHFRHEPCMMGWRKGSIPDHDGDQQINSVWELGWEGGMQRIVGNEHPTQKPVELFARPMRKHTKKGDLCYEPFSGSGSQLVAAQMEGRICYAMEISPVFVDVGVCRWCDFTGQDAIRESDGASFRALQALTATANGT